ncbi:MAG TPA: hypothetical protein VGW78_01455 [Candidatus Babeliales bacterium]|nr:hypothetical protein [Candidatus Babeliales bacterium]
MNIYIKSVYIALLLIVGNSINILYAISIDIETTQEFKRTLRKKDLVATLFYDQTNVERHNRLRGLKDTFNSISKRYKYDITFLTVDISKSGMQQFVHTYDLTHLPVILLFEDGRPVRAHGGKYAMLTDYVDRAAIKAFINMYLGDILQEKNQPRKPKKIKKIIKTRVYTPAYRPYWGWRYSYPYTYGYYPYYRGYYRPHFGIGFGFGY